ncbi:iron complex outermembrane recepter protein [Novimethylophilus kurashikiensis]|uniref:Iron complex outermembrane recepter protein n=1 Tax=Novimethylophilus kurashikiensis TaxID=1825523 RepID=A0A2R5F6T9_9PROT|nr:TonB-dependent receptor [Novimethylophilus kurashikiensis]GBG13785.1 iron complex outermembrane recepter protein [Novimethylophilus kurashikiensis]
MNDSYKKAGSQRFRRRQIAAALARLGSTALLGGGLVLASVQAHAADVPPELKVKVTQEALRGDKSVEQLAQEYQLEASDIATWKAQAANEKPAETTAATNELDRVVVTARNREEIAQDVPVPISVIGGKQLDRDRVVEIQDLTRKAPGLTATTPNARRTGVSIRGIGKASGNDSMEAAVGVIVDDVFLTHVGMAYQDFTDLDRVEVLRGPQGTLLGKNTTMGAINYVSKAPSFTPQSYLEVETGEARSHDSTPGALKAKGSYSNALIDDKLAYRASFFVDTQDGDFVNINPDGGDTYQAKKRFGGKLQLLYKPTDTFTAKVITDLAESREDSNTKPWIIDPTNYANGHLRTDKYDPLTNTWKKNGDATFTSRISRAYFGNYQPIIGSWSKIDIGQASPLYTNNHGISANLNWDLGPVALTSISAYRNLHFDAKNDSDQTKFDISTGGTLVDHEQYSQEFRLTSTQPGVLDYQAGLYLLHDETESTSRNWYGQDAGAFYASNSVYKSWYTNGNAAKRAALRASLDGVSTTSLTTPQTDSAALFGQINWHLTDKATLTVGLRDTYEDKTSTYDNRAFLNGTELTNAALKAESTGVLANKVKNLTGTLDGEEIKANSLSWLINPSYKVNDDFTVYASAARGVKSGSVQFDSKGNPLNVNPEKALDFELGFKSLLLSRALMLNVNLYQTTVKDYQATTSIVDSTSSTGYSSVLGNIPEIEARGVEVDGAYNVNSNLSFNFGGAYNHAIYTDWKNATCPAEVVATPANPTCDNTGKQVVGAPKWTGIVGFDYQKPLDGTLKLHAFSSSVVRSSQNLEAQLSAYGKQGGYSVTDAGIGLINTAKLKYEVDLVAKNLFDKKYTTSVNAFSNQAPVGYDGIGPRRYVGVVFKTNF